MKGLRGNRGAAVVEFAVLFLLLLVIIFSILEFGFIWLQSHYITNAAREGARIAATGQGQTQIEDVVKEYLKGVYADSRVNGGCCNSGDFIEVVIDDEVIDAGLPAGENPAAVKVTVTVQTSEVWEPILWDLLKLLPGGSSTGEISAVTEFAIFAVEEP